MSIKIVFQGEILDGFTEDKVKANFSKLFRATPLQLEPLFNGKKTILKECNAVEEAERIRARLQKAGARVWMDSGNHSRRAVKDSGQFRQVLFFTVGTPINSVVIFPLPL